MSLEAGQNKISYTVSTSTTAFEFPYKFWDNSDLVVTVTDNLDVETVLENVTDYAVTQTNGDPALGGTVTLVVAVDDHTVEIERVLPLSSNANYQTGDGIPPESLNSDFDKAVAMIQQLNEKIDAHIAEG